MKIQARIDRMVNKGNVKAIASVSLDGMFVVKGLKIMDGKKGMFVSMPQESYPDREGNTKYSNTFFALTNSARMILQETVLDAYKLLLQKRYQTNEFPRVTKYNKGERPMFYVEGSNAAIIPKEMFDRATELRNHRKNATKKSAARYFAKKLVCGNCGDLFRAKQVKKIQYWVCMTHGECIEKCALLPVPETEIVSAFLRFYYNMKAHPEILEMLIRSERKIHSRQMLWSEDIVSLNKEISNLISQSYKLTTMNRRGLVDPDIFIIKSNQLAEQLRKAKQEKERLQKQNENDFTESTQQIMDVLADGPEFLDTFDEELFCELIDKIIVDSNTKIRFRLKNGLELLESIERTVR